MHYTGINVAALALLAAGTSAKTIKVEVGDGGLMFEPDTITADEGDIVEFHFNSMHSVVAGDFDKACSPVASGGFYSGTLPKSDMSTFSITVKNTDPMFFYCSVGDHCQDGMVGVINEGSDKLDSYMSAAAKAKENVSPDAAFGGSDDSSSMSSGMMSSTSMSESMGMTMTSTESMTMTGTESMTMTMMPTDAASTDPGSAAPTTTTEPGAAGHLTGPIVAVGGLALFMAGLLVL